MIKIIAGTDKKLRQDFIAAAHHANQYNSAYIPRLNMEMRAHVSNKNPYFKHAIHQFFVAYDNKKPVGRISAHIDSLAQQPNKPVTGHFGFLDAIDSHVATALLIEAERWLASHGAGEIMGPFSFSINDESGLLIDGFDSPPYILMNHAPSWLGNALTEAGFSKAKDLIAYTMNIDGDFPASAKKMAEQASLKQNIRIRSLDPTNISQDLIDILEIFNEAWHENWGFIPMTTDEIAYMAKNIKPILIAKLGQIVEIDGKPAAMILALPNIMEAIRDLHGKLMPLGWIKLLWRLKLRAISSARVLLMGIRPQFKQGFMGAILSAYLVNALKENCKTYGIKNVEMSWILEDNTAMTRIIEAVGGTAYKRYRIYSKSLI